MKNKLTLGIGLLLVMALFVGISYVDTAQADPGVHIPNGIAGFSGNPATNGGLTCNYCHSGGITPTVTLTGPTVVAPNSTNTYTLVIAGGQEVAGGLDVSATDGTLAILPGATDTQILTGEVTHTTPKNVDGNNEVVYEFNWTAPTTTGPVTLYGAGNSVNLAQGFAGDAAMTTTLTIDVSTPTSVSLTSFGGNEPMSLWLWLLPLAGVFAVVLVWRQRQLAE